MNLLISNDDGIQSLGVRALANQMAAAGHRVTVVCPDQERSATGHGLTLHQPIRANPVESLFHPSVQAWACSGTPADCIKLAVWALLDQKPDLVLSGINHGANLGTDVLYSGTVSAAMEGLVEGIPSIAFSLNSFTSDDFTTAAKFAQMLVAHLETHPLPEALLLNVNIPAISAAAIAGVAITRQGIRRYIDVFEQRVDPRGKTYYWLAGELLEEVEDSPDFADMAMTDVQAARKNYITVTPLQYNLTSSRGLAVLQDWTVSFDMKT